MTSSRRPAALLPPTSRDGDRSTPGQRLLRNLHLLRVLVTASFEEGGLPAGDGVSVVQMSLLRLLAPRRDTPATIGDIARRLQVSAPAASKAVGRLAASGHVVSRADRADARRLHIEVTSEGRAAIRRYEAARSRRVDAIAKVAGPAAVERWITTLEDLVGALINAGRRDELPCLQCGLQTPPTCAAEARGSRCPVRALETRRSGRRRGGIS